MLDLDPVVRDLPERALHGRPVVDCPRCSLTFIGRRAHQDFADHSWTHTSTTTT